MINEVHAPRIVLVHALEESVLPARTAFRNLWPEAACFDLLDTSLAVDLAHTGRLDDLMFARFATLADYAAGTVGVGGPTAGILFTCSAFGPAIDAVARRLTIPVLRPNEAAFQEAINAGDRLGLVVSFGPSAPALARELTDMAEARGRSVRIEVAVAHGALEALKRGDGCTHDELVAAAAATLPPVDAVVLGQFSLARARARLEGTLAAPIFTTPESAVATMHRLVSAPMVQATLR